MNVAEAIIMPYEAQFDPQVKRTCGAACLSMVYRSFGKDVAQAEIWPAVAKQNRLGSLASTTYLMAQDALSRGFAAIAVQAQHPLQALRLCRDHGIRAILNHRLKQDVATGHYTVLVDIDDKNVVVHDPSYGPSRCLSHAELLELWQPRFPSSEIIGYVLIGIAAQPPALSACELCRTPIPSTVECPKCKKNVRLQPAALLRCVNSACMARMWNYICCPSCDYTWTFSLEPAQAGVSTTDSPNGMSARGVSSQTSPDSQAGPGSEENPLDLNHLFGELDKFCSHILSLPEAANHPEIQQQIGFIKATKESLKLEHAQQLAHRKARQEEVAELLQTAKRKKEEHQKKMEELNTPSAPLDGDALGRALLKNLGLID